MVVERPLRPSPLRAVHAHTVRVSPKRCRVANLGQRVGVAHYAGTHASLAALRFVHNVRVRRTPARRTYALTFAARGCLV